MLWMPLYWSKKKKKQRSISILNIEAFCFVLSGFVILLKCFCRHHHPLSMSNKNRSASGYTTSRLIVAPNIKMAIKCLTGMADPRSIAVQMPEWTYTFCTMCCKVFVLCASKDSIWDIYECRTNARVQQMVGDETSSIPRV